MADEPRIGVYVCHCGLNIASTVDVKRVVETIKKHPNVVVARDYVFMCSTPGQDMIREDIKKYNLNRVVVAACSPSMHEPTFRGVLDSAGLNKYLLEIANIREHCSWVHDDKEEATRKAIELVRMAVYKASLLEPVEEPVLDVSQSILILGGGVAGMRSALEASRAGFHAYIVEKSPTLGGMASRIGWVERNKRGGEIVRKIINSIKNDSRITIFTNARLIELSGYPGNFTAKIRVYPRYVNENCTLCRKCVEVCPVEKENEFEFGLIKRKAIYYPFKGSYPPYYVIDMDICTKCGKCVEVCPANAINLDEEYKELDLRVGAIILATGFHEYIPPLGEYGYGLTKRVITLFQLERLLDPDGPTGGRLEVDGYKPRNIAFIMCVGSRGTTSNSKPYCSRMCCVTALNNAIKIKEAYPESEVFIIYKDIMTYAGFEHIYEEAGRRYIKFIKFEEPPQVNVDGDNLEIIVYEPTIQEYLRLRPDLIVLATGMVPRRDINEVTEIIRGCEGPDGFFREAHLKLAPAEAPTKAVYLAGAATGPKNIIESIRMGSAAAAKAVSFISKGSIALEPLLAEVDEDRCSGCAICVSVCPYGAITIKTVNDDRLAEVEKALCLGCGACAAACPSKAMQHIGFKDDQIVAQIRAIFVGGE